MKIKFISGLYLIYVDLLVSELLQNTGHSIPLSKQVVYLNSTRAEMVAKAGSGAVSDLLAKSFFLFGVGSNDMFAFAAAQQKLNRSATPSEVEAFYTSLISNYSAAITVCSLHTPNPTILNYLAHGLIN